MAITEPRTAPPAVPTYRLPPAAYHDPAWYEREQRELFGRTWNYVGHVVDVPEPGSFTTAVLAGEPIVIVRTESGALKGYVNICRHRGMVIAECDEGTASGTCGTSLRCAYHGWEWDLEGTLVRVPQRRAQFPDLPIDELGLYPVAVRTWGGFIFAHPDPLEIGSFDDWLGDYPALCGDYPWDDFVEVERIRTPLACNWKLYIENHIDWLHLWYLHSDTLAMYDHHAGVIVESGLHWASAERLREDQERTGGDGFVPIPGLSEDEKITLRANLIFPNVPFVTAGNQVNTYQVVPTGPETCELDLRVFALPGGVLNDDSRSQLHAVLVAEDGGACERMQEAVHSPRFAVGPLAQEFERPIATFHESVMTFLGDAG